jgi:hypothetical protein
MAPVPALLCLDLLASLEWKSERGREEGERKYNTIPSDTTAGAAPSGHVESRPPSRPTDETSAAYAGLDTHFQASSRFRVGILPHVVLGG